jgi:hypothetical protein
LFDSVVEVTKPKLDQVPALPDVDFARKMAEFRELIVEAE